MPIVVEGLDQLSDMLTNIAPTAAKRWMRKVVGEGADVTQKAVEDNAPVYVGVLEESIVQRASFESGDGETELTIDIGPKKGIFWGSIQEFGSQEVEGTDKNGKHFHHTAQPAQRWVTHAWEDSRDRVLDVVATGMVGLLQDLENKQ